MHASVQSTCTATAWLCYASAEYTCFGVHSLLLLLSTGTPQTVYATYYLLLSLTEDATIRKHCDITCTAILRVDATSKSAKRVTGYVWPGIRSWQDPTGIIEAM